MLMSKTIDIIQDLLNQKTTASSISQAIAEATEGKTNEEQMEIAKDITMEVLLPKLLKASVRELIEIDFARYFESKVGGIDITDLMNDLVTSGYDAGLTECKDCGMEDGSLDEGKVIPVVQGIYSEVKRKYPGLSDVDAKTQKQLQTAVLFSMRAAIQNITKGDYLDLMIGENFPNWKEDANLSEEIIKELYR